MCVGVCVCAHLLKTCSISLTLAANSSGLAISPTCCSTLNLISSSVTENTTELRERGQRSTNKNISGVFISKQHKLIQEQNPSAVPTHGQFTPPFCIVHMQKIVNFKKKLQAQRTQRQSAIQGESNTPPHATNVPVIFLIVGSSPPSVTCLTFDLSISICFCGPACE